MATIWKEKLQKELIKNYGDKKASALTKKYANTFPHSYMDECSAEIAANDLAYIEKLSAADPLGVYFYFTPEQEYPLHVRLYLWEKPKPLSNILPMLENLGLCTYNESTHTLTLGRKQSIWICDLAVMYAKKSIEIEKISDLLKEALTNIYFGLAENDGFNKLVIGATLAWHEVMILRAYAKYLHQIRFRYSQAYIEKTLVNNSDITRLLVELFKGMHNPHKKNRNPSEKIEQEILQMLESVPSLDEDLIIRQILVLIKATLRTNYYQPTPDKESKKYLSLKLNSRIIPGLPLPTPLYEIFVYSPEFEGIHLRNTKVARGGIRWSERPEDYRTEVLGLMKAQKVKNAVIVPSGAKGGFVLKKHLIQPSRETLQAEVIRCYKLFISGLLDLTDNIKENEFVRPKNVVCYDDFDPYLVVAADKGTATFSDIANEIAKSYDFWLGDAFASGGIRGYDHKKIGITARGAWESVKRHFRELDINPMNTDITVVGIGDMSGDVFGNAMMYSTHIKLIAAFDHRHIFIDPDPNPETSYYERVRLFNLPHSSWADYNEKLISQGGGVFSRQLKSIPINARIKKALDIEASALTPNELICAILRAPVQLLFNGGIGTYVKASTESHVEVGDRSNDYCRVNGEDLRCKVVGEGGNLGFTQLGRVEYALTGGLINTDFIDNSAGVDCSDHEVNLKILLEPQVHAGKLSEKRRDKLLADVTDEVAELVLQDNYEQAVLMSYSAHRAKNNISLHTNYIKKLEALGVLDRKVEFLPDDKKLIERKSVGEGLTRPELAVLVAYTKIYIKNEILNSKLPEDPVLKQIAETAFPQTIVKKYKSEMSEHRLYREIIATQLSNQVVNEMGITFVYRLQMENSATVDEIVRAYVIASRVFATHEVQNLVLSLDFKIHMNEQYNMLFNIRNFLNLATRWFLNSKYIQEDLSTLINYFSKQIKVLEKVTPILMGGVTKQYLESLTQQFTASGLPEETARRIATYRAIYSGLNIIEVATQNKFDLIRTAEVYFAVGEQFSLLWFRDQLSRDTREGHWNSLSRLTIRDQLDFSQRALTVAILKTGSKEKDVQKLIQEWINRNQRALKRWNNLLEQLHSSGSVDYSMFFIAMRELVTLVGVKPADLIEAL
ncbi:NAD-glutamate dehydrogenase [Legionella micdadei]|uniref:Glutamate dehydrogenase n=1 Tax=Legionella micdadei TaxID=451 RepID=A0A098GID6_LEGMI|nr:NAD-glutamate dehydrogenase domain-containing protein [Legionella micdadei]ARG98661.1 NAD-glutamate dehydrogenase [Legionella micdadei]ARH01374.1 NAD-glutamate dehydrogenase [Legionella micdadei]KTD28869.1 NAD-glutamate dehydrogenase [Legionella micdadei]NSL17081.1 NAD-glutamate dehydrogenase [Legionella micdadei]CEG62249.1 NAD-glutamate dehydrogenase [Legionella micdadei]